MRAGSRRAALLLATGLGLSGCGGGGGGGSGAPVARPAPAPAPEPPPPPTVTWIGFAAPSEAELFAGSRTRIMVTIAGEPLAAALDLQLDHSAPASALDIPSEVRVEQQGFGGFDIERPPASGVAAPSRHEIRLRAPEDGFPPGVALSGSRDRFLVRLREAGPAGCPTLHLSATRERFNYRGQGGFSSARLLVEGPEGVGLRLLESYWKGRLEQWDEPPDLPIPLSQVADVPLIFPDQIPYRSAAGAGHSQRISLAWYNDLEVEAVTPGCAPTRLHCPVDTIVTQGCRVSRRP